MNTDIRLSVGFWSHPKVKRLARRCGLEGVRSLQILWMWAAQNRPDGNLSGMDALDIELAADWLGDEGALVAELHGRFLDGEEGTWELHDWQEHNSWAAQADDRSDAARLSRLARTAPETAAALKADGYKGISASEYQMYASGTPYVRRTYDEGTAYNDRTTDRSTPAPTYVREDSLSYARTREDGSETPEAPLDTSASAPLPDGPEESMPSLEWQELRAYYNAHGRVGGPMDGFKEYRAALASRSWPGQSAIYAAIDRWEASGQWDSDVPRRFAPSLGNFIARQLWKAEPEVQTPPQRDGPRVATQAQKASRTRDLLARNVAARRGLNVDEILGKATGRPAAEATGDRGRTGGLYAGLSRIGGNGGASHGHGCPMAGGSGPLLAGSHHEGHTPPPQDIEVVPLDS
ncbi:hypothetical protein DDE01_06570 [Desulfovibrio desulfuricans]|nr:hypothetical protein DDE01_06570 [Desulfovibrio desulfuricans]